MNDQTNRKPLTGKGTLELTDESVGVRYELYPGHDDHDRPTHVGSIIALDGKDHEPDSGTFTLRLDKGDTVQVALSPGIYGKSSWEARELTG